MNLNQKDINNINQDVAIIGIGFKIPSGSTEKCLSSPNELYESLFNGFNGVSTTSTRWSDSYFKSGEISSKYAALLPINEIKSFDPIFFGINPSDAVLIDPQQRLLLKCVWNALEDSGIDPITIRGTDTSVFIGSTMNDYLELNKNENTIYNITNSKNYSISNRISYCFDLRGESISIDTACSSSLNAINLGYNSILYSKSKLSIVGGINIILDPANSALFSSLNMCGPSGRSNSFSAEADGFVRCESVGIVVLKNLKDAINDGNKIYCVIKGSSSNVDGNFNKINYTSPSKSSQAQNIIKAIKSTNGTVSSSDIDYFECHGTGTPTGDPIECEGISIALDRITTNQHQLLIGSIKSNIGHGEASSGVVGLIKCCLMFKNKTFLPNINFKTPNPLIKFNEWNLKVVTEPTPFNSNKQTIMAINNFGLTGSNCCIILSEYLNNNSSLTSILNNSDSNNRKYIIPISSNSSTSLNNYKLLISNLSTVSHSSFIDFVNLQINKSTSLVQRSAIIASNWDEFNNQTNEIKSATLNKSTVSNITIQKKNPLTIFVFCGQGSQYNKMALSLYENEPVFKSSMDKFDKELSKHYGYSVLDKLRSINYNDSISIHQPILAQPANVMVHVSLYELYKHWGIKPDIIVGHSLGEVTSPYCSGMIDFETLCYITYHRSVSQNKTTGTGRMLSINISADEYLDKYSSKFPSIEIACYNSPTSIVIAGKEDLLNQLSSELKSKGVFCAMLGSLSSFHTSSQLMIKDEICSLSFKSTPSTVPVFSTVTSNLFNNETTPYNSEYIFENVLKPVNFTSTISNIYKYIESNDMGNEVTFIEIAPHPTLQYYLNQMKSLQSDYFIKGEKITVYSALNKKKNDYDEFLKTISTLYVNGYNGINFKSQLINNNNIISNNIKLELPTYQWDEKEYYKIDPYWQKIIEEGPSINNLGNLNDSPFKSFKTIIDTRKPQFQWLKGHSMKGKCVFPGMGYISNLLSIYNMDQDITINDIHFKSAFNLTDGVNNTLQTTIIPLKKNKYSIQCHFKDLNTNQWILCAVGNYNLFKHQIKNYEDRVDVQKLKSKCNYTRLSKNELYDAIKIKTGLRYKGLFQGVKECFVGNSCSLSIVSLNELENQTEFRHLLNNNSLNKFFNTAILDTCVHGMIETKEQSQIYFDKCEGFKYYSNNIMNSSKQQYQEIYVYAEKKSSTKTTISGSITIMLPDGTLLIEIKKVVCKSTIPTIDSTSAIEPPKDIYTPYLQPKDSLLNSPKTFKHLYNMEQFKYKEFTNLEISNISVGYLLYKYINLSCPTYINKESLTTLTLDQFKEILNSSINQHCIQFVFECLKLYSNSSFSQNEIDQFINESNVFKKNQIILKSTKIMAKLLFPLQDEDQVTDEPQFLFENGQIDQFYKNLELSYSSNNLLSEIVLESVKPIINKTSTFRILEAGSGVGSLSILILDKLEQLLQDNPSYRIDIEFTFTDISTTFLSNAKESLSKFKTINIVYKLLDLEMSLVDNQNIPPLYYDMVVISNVLHVVKDIKFSINELYKVLKPNGQLVFIEPPYKAVPIDAILGVFPQWWEFDDDVRTDRCCIEPSLWIKVLESFNFKDIMSNSNSVSTLIQTRKPSQHELLTANNRITTFNQLKSYNQIILYIGEDQNNSEIITFFKSSLSIQIIIINNINQFTNFIKSSPKINNSLIIFLKSINQLNTNNYKEITFEYIQIQQILLKLQLESHLKQILVTNNSQSNNYLSNSLTGTSRYLIREFPQSKIVSIDFDTPSINNHQNVISIIDHFANSNENIEKEYFIINNQINVERYKKEINLKSNTFQTNKDELMDQLSSQSISKYKYNISNLNLGKNILLTGQTGIILIVLRWLINHSNQSIDNIIIISKSKLKWELELIINETHNRLNNKIKIHYKQVDVGNNNEVEPFLNQLESDHSINDINSVFHFAFVNDIGDLDKVDMNRMNSAHHAKVNGAINLHNQSLQRKWNINQFVLASSIASIFGIEKQACYVSANSVVDSLSKYRKSIGLPSLTINIGAISSTGFVSRNDAIEANLSSTMYAFSSPQSFISTLNLFIQNTHEHSNFSNVAFNNDNLDLKIIEEPMLLKFDYQLNKQIFNQGKLKSNNSANDLNDLDGLLISKISEIISIECSKINLEFRLLDYGLDSLVIINLKNWIDEKFAVKISIQNLQNNKIIKICETIKNEINKDNNNGSNSTDINKQHSNNDKIYTKKQQETSSPINQFTEEFIQNEIKIPNDSLIKSRPYDISNILNQSNLSIFLTGSTGYLGAYLLLDLVKLDTIKSVFCLTRNKSNSINLLDDIISNLKKHQLYQDLTLEQLNKIKAVKGDITSDNLGLSNNDYSKISKECSIIINSAADLNLQQPYEQSKPGNVNCIKEIIKLSVSNENQQKLIINFSSITVFFNHKLNGQEYNENTVQPQLGNVDMGYVQSKIIAEQLLKYYGESFGIPSIVFRIPELWANPTTGIGNDNDTIQTIVQTFATIGGYTDNPNTIFCSPVTTISKYIIKIIFNINSWTSSTTLLSSVPSSFVYSLNGDAVYYNLFFKVLEEKYNCKEIDQKELLSRIEKSTHKSSMKFNTFDNIKDQSFLNILSVDTGFSMSKSTFNLLKSIDPTFNYNDFNINTQMIINHLNYSLNK